MKKRSLSKKRNKQQYLSLASNPKLQQIAAGAFIAIIFLLGLFLLTTAHPKSNPYSRVPNVSVTPLASATPPSSPPQNIP